MKIAIYGAGGVGCVIGAKLFLAGADVTLIARGKHLDALKKHGLKLTLEGTGEWTHPIRTAGTPEEAGSQDYVFLTCKSHDLPEAARHIAPLLRERTAVVAVGNGVPWWYFDVPGVKLEGFRPVCLDPEGLLHRHIARERIIGGVCYMGAELVAPGRVRCSEKPRVLAGEPGGLPTPRLNMLGELLEKAGFPKPLKDDIRQVIWTKLCWNIAFNPLSVLTHKNCEQMVADTGITARIRAIIAEMNLLGLAIGLMNQTDAGQQIEAAARMGAFKPSMLQDHENGKILEIEAIIGAVAAISLQTGTPAPEILELYREISKFS